LFLKFAWQQRASIQEKDECFSELSFNRDANSREDEIQSPISVLEPTPIETESARSSFWKPDCDLHGKSTSIIYFAYHTVFCKHIIFMHAPWLIISFSALNTETDTQITKESEVCISSDDDGPGMTCNNNTCTINLLRDQEEREYSYLLEMLIQSGVHRIYPGTLRRTYHSCEFPVNPRLFDRLEKRYSQMLAWSKSDRRLLFDLANAAIAMVLAQVLDTHPWVRCGRHVGPVWGPEGLVERVWLVLLRERQKQMTGNKEEKQVDLNRFENLGNDINVIGKQIERMVTEEMIEEVVLGFV
jgi:Domain of unknown function (DUF4378)